MMAMVSGFGFIYIKVCHGAISIPRHLFALSNSSSGFHFEFLSYQDAIISSRRSLNTFATYLKKNALNHCRLLSLELDELDPLYAQGPLGQVTLR